LRSIAGGGGTLGVFRSGVTTGTVGAGGGTTFTLPVGGSPLSGGGGGGVPFLSGGLGIFFISPAGGIASPVRGITGIIEGPPGAPEKPPTPQPPQPLPQLPQLLEQSQSQLLRWNRSRRRENKRWPLSEQPSQQLLQELWLLQLPQLLVWHELWWLEHDPQLLVHVLQVSQQSLLRWNIPRKRSRKRCPQLSSQQLLQHELPQLSPPQHELAAMGDAGATMGAGAAGA